MPRSESRLLALIGCRLFEDEVVHVLSEDKDINSVFLVDDEQAKDLSRKLDNTHLKTVKVKEEQLAELVAPPGFSVIVWLKPMALHQKPEKLRDEILGTLTKVSGISDSILLFYGLCGNAFRHFEKDTNSTAAPVTILRDSKGQIVDDCIGCVLGGTDEYLDQLKKSTGTFFLTPMWAANWRELFHKVQILPDSNDIEGARYIFRCVGYKKVLKMDTGLGDQEIFDNHVDEFAQLFEFEKDTIKCTLDVVETSYKEAKRMAFEQATS